MKKYFIKLMLILSDLAWLIFIYFATNLISSSILDENNKNLLSMNLQNFFFIILTILILFIYEKIYYIRYDLWQETRKIFKVLLFSFLIIFSVLALANSYIQYPKQFIIIYFILLFITFPIYKRYFKKLLFKYLNIREKVLIIGKGKEKEKIKKELNDNWYLGAKYSENNYNKVIIISNGHSFKELDNIINIYMNKVGDIFIIPYLNHINFSHSNILELTNLRLNTIELKNKLLIKYNIIIKTVFDKLFSLFLLPFLFIIHLVISLLIKKDSPGKIFYTQERLGRNGKKFIVYKYRTMYENGNEILKKYLKKHPEEIEYYNKYHKYKNDPRITKIGKFLRSSSLDELPQIINVIKGEMSIVGPRPYMISESKKLKDKKDILLKVKPGITGLWQVSGRNELSFNERIELDTWYIQNWSLWLDFVILVKTVKVVLKRKGAK